MKAPKPAPPHRGHDLDADLTTLACVMRHPKMSNHDRLRLAGNVLACIRIRMQLGDYTMSPRELDDDFVRDLALPTPN